jgi:DNA-binding response OmpR family regulator
MRLAWDEEFVGSSKAVDMCMLRLRKKIRSHLAGGVDIAAERGLGYRFVSPRPSVATKANP